MNKYYTIIIPVFNESSKIDKLILGLQQYHDKGHEILIIDDGSSDDTYSILSKYNFISLFRSKHNLGKGNALLKGLKNAKNDKAIIFDGDLELDPNDIKKLMLLNNNEFKCVFGSRYKNINALSSFWDLGNYFLTTLFNLTNKTNLIDALCCAKAFYISDLNLSELKSQGFNIDVEISSFLIKVNKKFKTIRISYKRRSRNDGKKLHFIDSLSIIKTILRKY